MAHHGSGGRDVRVIKTGNAVVVTWGGGSLRASYTIEVATGSVTDNQHGIVTRRDADTLRRILAAHGESRLGARVWRPYSGR